MQEVKAKTMKHQFTLNNLVAVLMPAALISCAISSPLPGVPDLTYSHMPPITIDVSRIEIINNHRSTHQWPHVEHNLPVPPLAAVKKWVADRMRAGGTENRAQFIIEKAGVVAIPLPLNKGVTGLVINEQAVRYEAKLRVRLEISSSYGHKKSYVTAKAELNRTASEALTLLEKNEFFIQLTEDLMNMLNSELELNIIRHLKVYLL